MVIWIPNKYTVLGCKDVTQCRCDISFDYMTPITGLTDIRKNSRGNQTLRTTVDSSKDTELSISLQNDGGEPAYGMLLEIYSTVLLSKLPEESCTTIETNIIKVSY